MAQLVENLRDDVNARGAKRFVVCWAAYFLLLCLIGWPRLCRAQLWAEDGKLFLAQALELQWRSLFEPYDGYLHTVPRLFALVWLEAFGVARFATAVSVFTYALLGAVMAMFTLPGYAWVVPQASLRFVVGVMVIFAPGLSEVLGNLANLHYVLLVGLALFALNDSRPSLRVWQLVVVSLACLTEGACWLLLLPYGLKTFIKVRRDEPFRREALCLLIIAICGCLHVAAYARGLESGAAKIARPALGKVFEGLGLLIGERMLVMPFGLGDGVEHVRAFGEKVELALLALPLMLLLITLWRRFGSLRALWLLSFCGTFILLLAMTFYVRPGTLELIAHSAVGYRARYAFATHFAACVLWVGAMGHFGRGALICGTMLLLGMQCHFGSKELPYRAFQPGGPSWRAAMHSSPIYDEAGRRCVDIAPPGWRACFFER